MRAAALLGVIAAVLGCGFWWQAVAGAPKVVPLGEVSPAGVQQENTGPSAGSSSGHEGPGTEPTGITVHVAGAVARPGVIVLPAGSRLHEAVAAAGGPTAAADPDRLNLAAVLEDGQKILVPERGEPEAAAGGTAGGAGSPGDAESAESGDAGKPGTGDVGAGGTPSGGNRVNLNTAGVNELGTLPRVGPVLAQRIVDWRKQHGRFRTVDELDAVEGIGPKLLEALLPLVRV